MLTSIHHLVEGFATAVATFFFVRKRRQNWFKACEPWKSEVRMSLTDDVFFLCYISLLRREWHPVRIFMLHQAHTLFFIISTSTLSILQRFTSSRRWRTTAKTNTSACRRIWFVQILYFSCLIRTKRFMGPGANPAEPPQTRCKWWFNKKYQRNKSKLS